MMSLKRFSLTLAALAMLALPVHAAATYGDASFEFKDGRASVVLLIDHFGELTFSRAVHPIPPSCVDWRVDEVRDNITAAKVPVQGFFALQDRLVRLQNSGQDYISVAIDACSFDKLLVCIEAFGHTTCGVTQSGRTRRF